MNVMPLLANPTDNGFFSIVPWRSFMPWFLFVASLFAAGGFVFGSEGSSAIVFASIFPNMMMGMVFGTSVRDQMNCPMTLCLPSHQLGYRHHLIIMGLLLNLLFTGLIFLSPFISPLEKIQLGLFSLILGLCIFFAVVHYLMVAENMIIFQVFFPFFWMMFSFTWGSMDLISDYMLSGFYWFVLLLALLVYRFWTNMGSPGLSRKLMEMPGTDTGFGGNINDMSELETSRQAWFYRKRQHWPIYRWIADLHLPFRNILAEHMLMVFKRTFELLLKPEFWMLFAIISFVHPWIVIQRDLNMLLLGYPITLMLYMNTMVAPASVSPFMPYSRMDRFFGLLRVNLFAVLLYYVFVAATYFFYQLLVQPDAGYYVYSFGSLALGILLFVPYVLLVQLVMGLIRNHLVLFMIAAMMLMMFMAGVIVAILREHGTVNAEAAMYWLAGTTIFYLVCLYGRFRSGSLSVL